MKRASQIRKFAVQISLFSMLLCTVMLGQAQGADLNVQVTNLTHGSYFTPLLITAHAGGTHLFQPGMAASPEMQATAECGTLSGFLDLLGGPDADTVENPAGGPLGPGMTTSADLNTDGTGHTHLSIVAMIVPSNDGFVGLNGLKIPVAPGRYTYYLNAYDAGTEPNDEIRSSGDCEPGQPGVPGDPGGNWGMGGTGVTSTETNQTVHIHRGVHGDSAPEGGHSDLVDSIHDWLNPVARLIVTVQ